MGSDHSSGTVIQWDASRKTGVVKDDTRDNLVYFALNNYALARYYTDEYQFMPNVGDAPDAQYHLIGGAKLTAELGAKRAIRDGAEVAASI